LRSPSTATYRGLHCVGAHWELQLDTNAVTFDLLSVAVDLRDPGYRAAMNFAVTEMADGIGAWARATMPCAVRLRHAAPPERDKYTVHYSVAPSFSSPFYELVYARDLPRPAALKPAEPGRIGLQLAPLSREQLTAAWMAEPARSKPQQGGSAQAPAAYSAPKKNAHGARFSSPNYAASSLNATWREAPSRPAKSPYLLGSPSPWAFFNVFERWTGKTPEKFQQVVLGI
jgi:hypothetical protein